MLTSISDLKNQNQPCPCSFVYLLFRRYLLTLQLVFSKILFLFHIHYPVLQQQKKCCKISLQIKTINGFNAFIVDYKII